MKVLIFTEAGKRIGFGHLTRCIGLYQAFREKNITPEIIVNGDSTANHLLRGVKYKKINWLEARQKLANQLKDVDVVIVDSYLAGAEFYKYISKTAKTPVYIDDYKRINYPGGIVVNPSIYGDQLKYPKRENISYFLGKDYIILREEFWNVPKKKLNKEIKDVLVTFGGMNHSNLANKIVNFLKKKFNFNFYVIDSTKKKLTDKEMLNLMLKADICISGGGQTTYELARVGVPPIGICFAENQKFNLEDWHKIGFMEYAGWHNGEKIFDRLVSAIEKLKDKKERLIRSGIGQKFVDGKGTRRIINETLKIWE